MKPFLFLTLLFLLSSCIHVKTEHKVEPIEINLNVRVKVEKELDNFFDDLDTQEAKLAH